MANEFKVKNGIQFPDNTVQTTRAPSVTGVGASGTWGISVTGNAATATTLQTARTINGVSFNGSADITVADSTKLSLTGGSLTGTLSTNSQVLIGTASSLSATEILQLYGSTTNPVIGLYSESDTAPSNIRQYRKRTASSPGVQLNDLLGNNAFFGWEPESGTYRSSAQLLVFTDGATALNSVPSRFEFRTTTVGATAVATRLTIDNAGAVAVAAGKIGPTLTQQHTMPAVASDTFTLNAATQTLTNKTLSTGSTWSGNAIAIANGGTGATTAAGALTALGAQAALVSGINVKTVNGNSLLGSGDIIIEDGGVTTGKAIAMAMIFG